MTGGGVRGLAGEPGRGGTRRRRMSVAAWVAAAGAIGAGGGSAVRAIVGAVAGAVAATGGGSRGAGASLDGKLHHAIAIAIDSATGTRIQTARFMAQVYTAEGRGTCFGNSG